MVKKININKYIDGFFIFCIFLSIFKPTGFTNFIYFNNLLKIIKGISLIYMAIKIINNKKFFDYTFLVYYVFFGIIYIINSLLNHTEYYEILNNLLSNFILMCFVYGEIKSNTEKFLKDLCIFFYIIISLQILSMILIYTFKLDVFGNENGIKYFLGLDNYSAFAVIPMISIILFRDVLLYKNISKKNIILIVLLTICYLYTQSVTAFIALLIFLISIIALKNNKNVLKYVSARKIAIVLLVVTILIITLNIQNIFSFFLENLIKKGVTLNSRTIIWRRAIELIKSRPFFGWGELSRIDIKNYVLFGAEHAHNIFLELLLRTGIIGTVSYLVFIDKAVSNVYNKENTLKEISVLLIGVIAFEIISFMDCYIIMPYQYIVIAILYYYNENHNMDIERKIINSARKFFKRTVKN